MSSARTIVLTAQPLTPESFAPFGALPSDEGNTDDVARAEFLWADGCVNYISHHRSEVVIGDGRLRCNRLNRHDTHTQTLMPTDAEAVIVVAPARVDFSDANQLAAVSAFLIERYQCLHLWRGTWHWGPFPTTTSSVRLLNVQGLGYPRDNTVAHLDTQHGVVLEIARAG